MDAPQTLDYSLIYSAREAVNLRFRVRPQDSHRQYLILSRIPNGANNTVEMRTQLRLEIERH